VCQLFVGSGYVGMVIHHFWWKGFFSRTPGSYRYTNSIELVPRFGLWPSPHRRSVVESDFYTKLKKLDVQGGKTRYWSCETGVWSARSVDSALHLAGAGIWFYLCAFIGSLEPLLEGLLVEIHMDLGSRGFGQNRTGDLWWLLDLRSRTVTQIERKWIQCGRLKGAIWDSSRDRKTDTFIVSYLCLVYSVMSIDLSHVCPHTQTLKTGKKNYKKLFNFVAHYHVLLISHKCRIYLPHILFYFVLYLISYWLF